MSDLSFRGEKLGDLLIGEVIDVSKGNGLSKLYLDTAHVKSSAIFYTSNLDLMKQLFIQSSCKVLVEGSFFEVFHG